MDDVERAYPYRLKWVLILGGLPLFGGWAFAVGREALRNESGMVLNGVIEVGPRFVTGLHWAFCALGLAGLAVSAWAGFLRLAYDRRVAFGPAGVAIPAARWSPREVEIACRDIRECTVARVGSNRFLHIAHPGGTHTVMAAMLRSGAAFDEVCELLAAKVRAAKSAAVVE